MAQTITPALEAILASKLQVGDDKPRAEIEIDYVIPGYTELGTEQDLALSVGTAARDASRHTGDTGPGKEWQFEALVNDGSSVTYGYVLSNLAAFEDYLVIDLGAAYLCSAYVWQLANTPNNVDLPQWSSDGISWNTISYVETGLRQTAPGATLTFAAPISARYWSMRAFAGGYHSSIYLNKWEILGTATEEVSATFGTVPFQVASISLDRSRKMAAAQLDVLLENEAGTQGWYTGDGRTLVPNNPIRAYAWYGDEADRVCVFTGLLDRLSEHRNPKQISIKARSRMKWLLEQGFEATGPQGADEDDAIRTEDNGVYISKTIEYIVADILDRGGWPSSDRVIDTTGITLAEYVIPDGSSWADAIAGSDRLTTAANCDFWEDETGVVHFEPSPLTASSEPATVWDFAAGQNVMALDHEVSDEDRATRVLVSGPMTTSVPVWKQVWGTSKLDHPAGVWYDPADPDYIRVVDRVTKYIYRMKQSDRSIASKKYLGGYPLGLSGDPTLATHYYVLHAPWRNTGSTSGNSVKRYLKSDNSLVSTSTLPNGRWTDMKFDGTHLWLTNYDDGKLYKKTYNAGGAAGATANYTIVYGGVTQTQATGMWLNGTAMGLFFSANKRFLLVDTSAPSTVTGVQSTKGTRIAGGEIDTDTDVDLYAVAGAGSFGLTSGMVAKFTLAELVTNDVAALAVDWDLEDALGFQSGIADRTHTDCPNDATPHPYETRLATYAMTVVQSLAQAQDVADARLILLSRLARVLDLGTIGHPAVQVNDPINYADAIAGINATWVIDSYRARIADTYTQTMSVLPWEAP